ncbi:hypothetical protein ACHAXT_010058 [Thalassiosira profunda]
MKLLRKNKKTKQGDDMSVALTSPGALSSSSGADESWGGGSKGRKRFVLRKKKHAAGNPKPTSPSGERSTVSSSLESAGVHQPPISAPPALKAYGMNDPPPLVNAPQPQARASATTGDMYQNSSQQPRLPQQLTKYPQQQQQSRQPNQPAKSSRVQGQPSSSKNPPPALMSANKGVSSKAASQISSKPPQLMNEGGKKTSAARVPSNATSNPPPGSGWSVASNDESSGMNSENYIQSLNSLPAVQSGKAYPMLSAQPGDRIRTAISDDRIQAALSRQFGRSYPPEAFQQKWLVKVGAARWDDDEGRHKYKITFKQNPSLNDEGSSMADSYSRLSFVSTSARRSLQDFVWLEKALRSEFHGALLVPLLSLALYFGAMPDSVGEDESQSMASRSYSYNTDATSKGTLVNPALALNGNAVPESLKFLDDKIDRNGAVDETILANWLSDVINGVRGSGEVLLSGNIDVVDSEAMETFLYRHSDSIDGFGSPRMGINQRSSGLGSPLNLLSSKNKCTNKSLLETFMENPFDCFGVEACGVRGTRKKAPLALCPSGGVSGVQSCTSVQSQLEGEVDLEGLRSSGIGAHSELLEAERDLIASYLKSSLVAMSKVQLLAKDEAFVGQCWKRFAISLSNLFSVEKDLEQAHIGDQIKCNKKNQPFRKLRKSAVDEALRILARAKMERSSTSLRMLGKMLNAYYADLNSVIPAFRELSDAVNQLDEVHSVKSHSQRAALKQQQESSSMGYLKHLTWGQLTGGGSTIASVESEHTDEELSTLGSLSTAQTKALQTRVLGHEKMLRLSVTHLCNTTPLRNARMAWWYLKTEATQAMNVHTAATSLRQKLSIDPDAAAALKDRKYDEDEAKDDKAELELVKRIVDLGSDDEDTSPEKEASRRNAIRIASEQVGRWNAKTALALMEAAGVEDAEVQIDETSRELRHVRKYAISLRENVSRCLESAGALEELFVNTDGSVRISQSRREFWASISSVFSGKIITEETVFGSDVGTPSTQVLASAGIDITDRGGWLGHNELNQQRRNCGEAARQYLKRRDNQASILISRVVKLLKDYERRLEGIESFVYMHCVGIQLEKHCSKARSKALSAWEKRTDISTAINVATKKKIPKLVQELKVKLDALPQVSHTTVLKRKEEHLASKTLKSDLHKHANRRFARAQEVSTERVIAVMSLWAKHEESVATEEVKAIGEAVSEVELSLQMADIEAALEGPAYKR